MAVDFSNQRSISCEITIYCRVADSEKCSLKAEELRKRYWKGGISNKNDC